MVSIATKAKKKLDTFEISNSLAYNSCSSLGLKYVSFVKPHVSFDLKTLVDVEEDAILGTDITITETIGNFFYI